jgi:hypothetical protein
VNAASPDHGFGLVEVFPIYGGPGDCRNRGPLTRLRALVAAFAVVASIAFVAGAAEEKPSGRSNIALTFFVSSGWAFPINGSPTIDLRLVGIRWSRRWKPTGKGCLWGNPTVSVEFVPAIAFDQRPDAWARALNLVYEHRLLPTARVHPVARAGAGVLYANREVPPGGTRLNFSVFGGIGLDIDLSKRVQLAPEYRFHHVSNANTGPINPGINAHTVVLGLSLKLG